MIEHTLHIQNRLGLHARASACFVSTASRFACEITLIKSDLEVNGKSIMGIMMLAAANGSSLIIRASGSDEFDAVEAIEKLVNDRFGEAE
ncbi:MAG: HPr family phosphocarrier protein [Mariprofundaceae bacterium]